MVRSIEVFLQPPSPTMSHSYTLPPVQSLFPATMDHDTNTQQLPSIRITDKDDDNNNNLTSSSPRLNIIEPSPDLSISTSPYQQSPIMTFSSPSSATSSIAGSPLISPIQDGPFLLPPPDSSSSRRCRSVSNSSNNLSPPVSPSYQFTFRSLSEPPTLNLASSSTIDEKDQDTNDEECHPIFGPKRKRGRPTNASRPEIKSDSNWTFVKPTVWDVKQGPHHQQQEINQDTPDTGSKLQSNSTLDFYADNSGVSTFTTTNMNVTLNIPKKKRGRKPKKEVAGNSCFVWKDLTAPRGANKPKKTENTEKTNQGESSTSSSKSSRTLLLPVVAAAKGKNRN